MSFWWCFSKQLHATSTFQTSFSSNSKVHTQNLFTKVARNRYSELRRLSNTRPQNILRQPPPHHPHQLPLHIGWLALSIKIPVTIIVSTTKSIVTRSVYIHDLSVRLALVHFVTWDVFFLNIVTQDDRRHRSKRIGSFVVALLNDNIYIYMGDIIIICDTPPNLDFKISLETLLFHTHTHTHNPPIFIYSFQLYIYIYDGNLLLKIRRWVGVKWLMMEEPHM